MQTRSKEILLDGSGGMIPYFKRVYYQVYIDQRNSCCPIDLDHMDELTKDKK